MVWNKQLLVETLNTLKLKSEIVEKKKLDWRDVDLAYLDFKQVLCKDLWIFGRYISYFDTVRTELLIE